MAANHHPAQRPHAPPPNRAPQAGQPDLELLPLITDAFIDSLTATEARRWAELAMPATVASAVRKTCTTEHRRDILKFFRDLKRTELKAAAAQPAAPNQAPPEPQAAAPQYGHTFSFRDNGGDFTNFSYNAPAPPPPFVNRQSERDPGALFLERFDAYRGRYPHGGPLGAIPRHSSHINRSASRDRPPPPGPRPRGPPPPGPRPRGPPSPGPRPPAAASGGGNAPAANETSSSVNAEDVIHRRAYNAYYGPPPDISRSLAPPARAGYWVPTYRETQEAAFAREAGVAARDMHDAGHLHGPGSRGYF